MNSVETQPAIELDLAAIGVRALNSRLHTAVRGERFVVHNPGGLHALAAGLTTAVDVEIDGHAGYYCAGMNQEAAVTVRGNAGVGVAENMMSGRVEVHGAAGQSAGATAHGGLLVVRGDAAARCAISLKGADLVVEGSVGHATAFMAQSGRLLVLGDAGEGFGDSIYEARLYVFGSVASLGADCIEKPMREEHAVEVSELLAAAGVTGVDPLKARRYGSARQLYHWQPGSAEAS